MVAKLVSVSRDCGGGDSLLCQLKGVTAEPFHELFIILQGVLGLLPCAQADTRGCCLIC